MLSADMKRADALTLLASQALASMADDVRPHRRPITISVAIDLPTLLGLGKTQANSQVMVRFPHRLLVDLQQMEAGRDLSVIRQLEIF